jgi:hypothetical protein
MRSACQSIHHAFNPCIQLFLRYGGAVTPRDAVSMVGRTLVVGIDVQHG